MYPRYFYFQGRSSCHYLILAYQVTLSQVVVHAALYHLSCRTYQFATHLLLYHHDL